MEHRYSDHTTDTLRTLHAASAYAPRSEGSRSTEHRPTLHAAQNLLLAFLLFMLAAPLLHAQISIGGNVYGGGNEGDTGGNTNVTIRTGQIKNVFGGARMADVGGRAFVNLDGENGSGMIVIASVYGGNDISGARQRRRIPPRMPSTTPGAPASAQAPEVQSI